ncbi:MAG: hypothetical protein ABI408_09760 [Gemmatimonadaceae bacterium]
MRHTNGEGVLFLALLTVLAACADPVSRTVGVNVRRNVKTEPASSYSSEERVALTKIARLVANAMDNEPARQHLKSDMKKAPFREHKLELAPYLRSRDGRALLDRMVALNGGTETDLFGTLSAIRRLEFYMPVAAHREKWTGSADVLVVSQLDESGPIVAFDERGNEVALDRNVAPVQPALSIVPVETRFDQPLPAASFRNARDANGAAIGTLEARKLKQSSMVACNDTCGGDGGGVTSPPPTVPPGLYLEFSRILDMKEPWFRGDPEIEVHIHGPTDVGNSRYGADLSCSGEHVPDFRKTFDQNTAFWEGRVMLFSGAEAVAYASKFNQGFHVIFWEDDNESCTLKLDNNALIEALRSTANATATVAIKLIPGVSTPIIAGIFFATLFSNPGAWLLTNDDFLGVAVDQASAGYNYPGNTHVIMDGQTLNGRATLVYR